jgi:Na+/H+ antiporter NhaC
VGYKVKNLESTLQIYLINFGIAGLVSAADIATANNTISIIMSGPLAKNIADEYIIFICNIFG